MAEQVAIIGDGQMGLVLADALAWAGVPATIWGPFPENVSHLATHRENPGRFPGYRLPDAIQVEVEAEAALAGATLAINAIPSQFVRPVWTQLAMHVPHGCPLVSVAKGVETETLLRPTEVLAACVPNAGVTGVLSGPSIARELADHLPAVLVSASSDEQVAQMVQSLFAVPWLRVYTSSDVLGVELAGACKNVIALAAGICDGLELGDNAKSAVLARGLAEITRLGLAMGAEASTFAGVAGVGDLATTCFSPHGRNRSCGEALGRGESLEAYEARSHSVVEGVATTQSVMALAAQWQVDMPIAQVLHEILFEGRSPASGVESLMSRQSGRESNQSS